MSEEASVSCGDGSPYDGRLGLRVASLFVILITSAIGTVFPILAKRIKGLHIPKIVFDTAKYFGSGVIIATAFIHLMAPAEEKLGDECLQGTWKVYPWVEAIAMGSVFGIFIVEFFAFRIGTAYLDKRGLELDPNNPISEQHTAHEHGPSPSTGATSREESIIDAPKGKPDGEVNVNDDKSSLSAASPLAKILGVLILEAGIIFHSVIIGLNLAVSDEIAVLFPVLIFHQAFEGLGLGARLAELELSKSYNYVAYVGAILYSLVTPLGIAIGLGVRESYDPHGRGITIVSGVLNSISAGILIYTGLVELLAHEFIFHGHFKRAPLIECLFALFCVFLGAGIMALLGYWA